MPLDPHAIEAATLEGRQAGVIADLRRQITALERRRSTLTQYDVHLLGSEPRAAHALQAEAGTTYLFPGSALSASTHVLLSGLNAHVAVAKAQIVWTPNATGCGVEIITADDGPSNIVQIAEATGSVAVTPINTFVDVTTALREAMVVTSQGVPNGSATKTLGYRTRGDGTVGPLVFSVRILALLQL